MVVAYSFLAARAGCAPSKRRGRIDGVRAVVGRAQRWEACCVSRKLMRLVSLIVASLSFVAFAGVDALVPNETVEVIELPYGPDEGLISLRRSSTNLRLSCGNECRCAAPHVSS